MDIDKIEKAVDNMIDSWDLSTLMNFAFEDRLEYFIESADKEEVTELLKEFG
jgi:hypothetical protein|tara:strand:+ start:757 stop:912 length:156 start_codon:yes stop_codon:yes gene_type:complete